MTKFAHTSQTKGVHSSGNGILDILGWIQTKFSIGEVNFSPLPIPIPSH